MFSQTIPGNIAKAMYITSDEAEAEEYDKKFPQKVKEYRSTQEEFFIACRAFLE